MYQTIVEVKVGSNFRNLIEACMPSVYSGAIEIANRENRIHQGAARGLDIVLPIRPIPDRLVSRNSYWKLSSSQ